MDRKPVTSSQISSAGYDPVTRHLEVEFTSGRVAVYFEVEQGEFAGFEEAESKGKYLNEIIKPYKGFAYAEK